MSRQAALDAFRAVLWWLLVVVSVILALILRKNRSKGWTLWKLIFGAIVCQTVYITMWAIHNSAVRSVGLGALTDNLYRLCIPLDWLATASFLGLLLTLAAGYCITRSNLGPYKAQVIGLPLLVFISGVVTQYINFQMLEATNDDLDLFELAGWEAGLFAVCTFVNVAAFLFWVVYIFEIIQAEVDALRAQQELNLVRNAAPSSVVAPFPSENGVSTDPFQPRSNGIAASDPHAAPPPGMDPDFVRAAAEEGVVAYKNLLGPGQNMSHIPGADVEAQEITTVADMLNFETKSSMYKKFTTGFGVYILAQLCVFLSPVFIIDIVQDVITLFQFLVVYAFLAALLWLFRPLEDSPYLLMGEDVGHLDTALGVDDDDDNQYAEEYGASDSAQNSGYGTTAGPSSTGRTGASAAVEMTAATGGAQGKSLGGAADGAAAGYSSSRTESWDQSSGRDQTGGGALPVSNSAKELSHLPPDTPAAVSPAAARAGPGVGEVPVALPAIRTSIPERPGVAGSGTRGSQQQSQQQSMAAFSLGDEDELHEIKLTSSPTKSPSKRD